MLGVLVYFMGFAVIMQFVTKLFQCVHGLLIKKCCNSVCPCLYIWHINQSRIYNVRMVGFILFGILKFICQSYLSDEYYFLL